MTRRNFFGLAATAAFGTGYALDPKGPGSVLPLIFVSMTGGPSHTDLFDFEAGSWTPDWMDPVRGFPRGLMPRLAEHLDEIHLIRGLRAYATDHRIALEAHPACEVSMRANRGTFAEACMHARGLLASHRSVRINFGNWDHHGHLYENLRPMCAAFDSGLSGLMNGLKRDGRPVRIVAMGEFGRKPGPLNQNRGRDHYPVHAALAWTRCA